ncbi:hypothetical protein [Paenibacillus luteus]|nr:hypothetical protein [Paenibacillus luteus]
MRLKFTHFISWLGAKYAIECPHIQHLKEQGWQDDGNQGGPTS